MTRIVLATLAEERGGVWRHMLDLADGMRSRGHQVILALPEGATDLRDDARHFKFAVAEVGASTTTRYDIWHMHLHKTFDYRLLRLLSSRMYRRQGAVVLTEHLPQSPSADRTMQWDPTLRPGIKKPGARHAKTAIKRFEVYCCQAVIVPSEAGRQFMLRRYGIPKSKVHMIQNGVALLPRADPLPTGPHLRVAVVGALAWRKGHDVLIEAARVARTPWEVVAYGEGEQRAALERAAGALDRSTFKFAGYRSDAENASAEADVLCLPSRLEANPYVVLEAMMRSRPVVATSIPGLAETVVDGVTGLLVAADDPSALAAALDRLALDPALRMRLGAGAYEHALERFTIDRMVDAVVGIYDQILG